MKKNKTIYWFFGGTALACIFLFIPAVLFAASCTVGPIPLEIGIGVEGQSYGLTDYIAKTYKFIVGVIGILSAVMIMFNGLKWIGATGNSEVVGQAKEGVVSALVGLVIALMSYTVLYNINTKLVDFPEICPTGLSFDTTGSWGNCTVAAAGQSSECASFDYCQNSTEGCSCTAVNGKYSCRPIGTGVIPKGQKCTSDANCVQPLKCLGATATAPGTCTDVKEGTTCSSPADCEKGLSCVEVEARKDAKQCLTATGRSNGQYCSTGTECLSGVCNASNASCSTGDGKDGYPCLQGQVNGCKNGYECKTSSGCTIKGVASPCDGSSDDCWSGDLLDSDGDGTPDDFLYCVDAGAGGGYWCQNGSTGSSCDNIYHCKSRKCTKNVCE